MNKASCKKSKKMNKPIHEKSNKMNKVHKKHGGAKAKAKTYKKNKNSSKRRSRKIHGGVSFADIAKEAAAKAASKNLSGEGTTSASSSGFDMFNPLSLATNVVQGATKTLGSVVEGAANTVGTVAQGAANTVGTVTQGAVNTAGTVVETGLDAGLGVTGSAPPTPPPPPTPTPVSNNVQQPPFTPSPSNTDYITRAEKLEEKLKDDLQVLNNISNKITQGGAKRRK